MREFYFHKALGPSMLEFGTVVGPLLEYKLHLCPIEASVNVAVYVYQLRLTFWFGWFRKQQPDPSEGISHLDQPVA